MGLVEPIVNFGALVVITALYLYQMPKMTEKVTQVIEANTAVIRDTKVYHERMEECLLEMKQDIEDIKKVKATRKSRRFWRDWKGKWINWERSSLLWLLLNIVRYNIITHQDAVILLNS